MRKFVGSHAGVPALAADGVVSRVGQYGVLSVSDHSSVFHGEPRADCHGNVVDLLVWERYVEVVFKALNDCGGNLRGVPGPTRLTLGHNNAHRNPISPGHASIEHFKRSHSGGDEIAWQRLSLAEDDALHAVRFRCLGDLRRVGEGAVGGAHVERKLPGRFEIGLIEAGEGATGIGGFELRIEVSFGAVLALKDAGAVFEVDFALVADVDRSRSGGDFGECLEGY